MATHRIKVQDGTAIPLKQRGIASGDDVLWVPESPKTTVEISFGGRSPVEWDQNSGGPGTPVRGTVQATASGSYPYSVGNSPILAGPELIVDGGLTKSAPAKRPTRAKPTRTRVKPARRAKATKRARSTKRTKPARRTKSTKRAAKKR